MTITNFIYEGSYLPGVICNIVVKAHFGRSTPNASWDIYYGMYLAAILDSSRKVGISFYFWIIRLVNSQLALYSHVRCNPLNTPKMTITNFNYEGSYLPGLICNIIVKAHLGRSTPLPHPHRSSSWSEWQFWMFTIRAHIGRSPGRSTKHQTLQIPHRALCKGNVECVWSSKWWPNEA